MHYFSELQGRKVYTEDGLPYGILQDLMFLYEDSPRLTKIVIKTKENTQFITPISCLKRINANIVISQKLESSFPSENELSVVKNLLDKQIIDLVGNKVVRVNDVIIQSDPFYYVSGVDIGFFGILRRLGVEKTLLRFYHLLRIKPALQFLSWADIQSLEIDRGEIKLKQRGEKLSRINAEDLADYLEQTNIKNISKVLNILDEKKAIEVINNLNINYQQALFNYFSPEKAAKIISFLDPDEAIDILLALSKKKEKEIIDLMDPKTRKEVSYLLKLSQTPIGDLITTDFVSVSSQTSVKEVIDKLRKETFDFRFLTYVYVLNEAEQLVGVFNLHELLLQPHDAPVYKFMVQNLIVIHLTTPEEIAWKKLIKYKLFALPVVNIEKKLLGIVTFDDVSESMQEKTEW